MTPAAVLFRVSTDHQDSDNQVPDVNRFCDHHGYAIGRRFTIADSAWKDDEGGPEYQAAIREVLDAAWRGEFKVLVVWALDRITRLGAEDALRLNRLLRERGCLLVSVMEPWFSTAPDVMIAFAGWNAQQESKRRSDRIKAGLAKRKAAGLPVGRKLGAKDARPRRTAGYRARYQNGVSAAK